MPDVSARQMFNDKRLDERARRLAATCIDKLNAEISSPQASDSRITALAAALDAAASFVQDDDEDEEGD